VTGHPGLMIFDVCTPPIPILFLLWFWVFQHASFSRNDALGFHQQMQSLTLSQVKIYNPMKKDPQSKARGKLCTRFSFLLFPLFTRTSSPESKHIADSISLHNFPNEFCKHRIDPFLHNKMRCSAYILLTASISQHKLHSVGLLPRVDEPLRKSHVNIAKGVLSPPSPSISQIIPTTTKAVGCRTQPKTAHLTSSTTSHRTMYYPNSPAFEASLISASSKWPCPHFKAPPFSDGSRLCNLISYASRPSYRPLIYPFPI
jgi:hypothetical protein